MGCSELLPRVYAPILAPEPFAVDEVRAGKLDADPGACEPLDRFAVERLGCVASVNEGLCACQHPEGPVRARRARALFEPRQRVGSDLRLARTSRRLDELWQRRTGVAKLAVVTGALRAVHGDLVPTQPVV